MPPLTSEGWEKLFQLAGSEPVSYAKDAVIMQDGEAHEFVYRLQQGSVRVEKGDPRFSASRTAVAHPAAESPPTPLLSPSRPPTPGSLLSPHPLPSLSHPLHDVSPSVPSRSTSSLRASPSER